MKTGTKAIGEWAWERKIELFGMSLYAKPVELIRNVPRYRGQDIICYSPMEHDNVPD